MKCLAVALVFVTSTAFAQEPRLTNGRVTPQAVRGSLDATIDQIVQATTEPAWIAYAAPVADGRSQMCCWSGPDGACCGGCRLEPGGGSVMFNRGASQAARLEPPDAFFVFYRVENRRIERIRMFSEDCAIDAGGRAIHWLTGVNAAESVAVLTSMANKGDEEDRVMKGAVSAIAQHGHASAVSSLLRLARDAPATRVRGDALFWLAQRAGDKAAAAITEAIDRDPDTEVKKRAVFALSQLPKDEGVPKLIEVARSNRNPAVRKKAMFWLGQSNDPRALKFFEEVLK
jgi:hypothetical protein